MAHLPIKSPPEFSSGIRAVEITDRGHPSTFNPQYETLVNNDVYLKEKLDQLTAHSNALFTTNWTGAAPPYTQTVAVAGILSTDVPIVDVVLSGDPAIAQTQEKAWGCVSRISTAAGSITAYCNKKKPTVEIPVQLKVVR